jgi:hypothetical protein
MHLLQFELEFINKVNDLHWVELACCEIKGMSFLQIVDHFISVCVVFQMSEFHFMMVELTCWWN